MGTGILLAKNGVDELTSSYLFGIIYPGSVTGTKFGFMNDKARSLTPIISFVQQDENDMFDFMTALLDEDTLSCPYGVSAELVAQVHTLDIDTYYYSVSALNQYSPSVTGKTGLSSEASVTILDANHCPQIVWNEIDNAIKYDIFRSKSSGIYTGCLLTSVTGTSYMDTGAVLDGGNPPTGNTTAGSAPNWGTPPVSGGSASLALESVPPGAQAFFWTIPNPAYNLDESLNPRFCLMRISE